MRCIHCKEPLSPGATVCWKCGQHPEVPGRPAAFAPEKPVPSGPPGNVCPNCRMPVRPEARFCPSCGSALRVQAAPEGDAWGYPPPSVPAAPGMAYPPTYGESAQKGGKGKSGGLRALLLLAALLVGAGFAFVQAGGLALLEKEDSQEIPHGIEFVSMDEADMPSFQPIDDAGSPAAPDDGAPADPAPESSEAADTAEAEHESGSSAGMGAYLSTGQWYSFPHSSFAYMQTEEDHSYVYSVRPRGDSAWQGDLLVLDKESHDVSAFQLFEAPTEAMIYSFTLVDEYIYFGVAADDYATSCAYYRVDKSGGDAELLFVEEAAFLTSYQGYVLLMLPMQHGLGVYAPDEERLTVLPLLEEGEGNDWLYSGFSVHDGLLYYGQHGEAGSRFYYRPFYPQMPNIAPRILMLESGDTVTDVVYDFENNQYSSIAYLLDDYQYELRFGEIGGSSYQSPLQFYIEDFPFAARHGRSVYAQSDGQLIEYFLDEADTGAHTYHYPLDFSPVGICREFLFFPGEIRRLADGELIHQGTPLPGNPIVLENFGEALGEMEARG